MKRKLKIWQLATLLVVVVGASVLFALGIGLVISSSNPSKVILGSEYACEDDECTFMSMDAESYGELASKNESFVIFIDQGGCLTASTLRSLVYEYMEEKRVRFYRMSFSEMEDTDLHENIKYYPSVAMVAKGKLIAFLHADSDDDADAFSDKAALFEWISNYLVVENSIK